jgi:hypothetical protein
MAREPFFYTLTSKWVGAFIFWLLYRFKGSYKSMLVDKYYKRNIWVGYFIQLFIFLFFIYFFVK